MIYKGGLMSIIKNLISKIETSKIKKTKLKQEREFNKPKYSIHSLYVGSIIQIADEWYTGDTHHWKYRNIKDYAIFEQYDILSYFHIVSNKRLEPRHWDQAGQYVIDDYPKAFEKVLQSYLFRNNLTPNDKLSKRQIIELENELNKNHNYNPKHASLFEFNQ